MGSFNLGNVGGLLSLADRNRAASSVAGTYPQNGAVQRAAQRSAIADMSGGGYADPRATRSLGSVGANAMRDNPYAEGMGAIGNKAVQANPYDQQRQGPSGWDQTQRYLGGAAALQSQSSGGQKNGLSKVLGLVGMFKGLK